MLDSLLGTALMESYTTAIRSLHHHVVCNGPLYCKANGVGIQLGARRYSDLKAIVKLTPIGYKPNLRCRQML